jgi:hypothetical protein
VYWYTLINAVKRNLKILLMISMPRYQLKYVLKGSVSFLGSNAGTLSLCDNVDIPFAGQTMPVKSKKFAHHSFQTIALDSLSNLFRYRYAQS